MHYARAGSSPASRTIEKALKLKWFRGFFFLSDRILLRLFERSSNTFSNTIREGVQTLFRRAAFFVCDPDDRKYLRSFEYLHVPYILEHLLGYIRCLIADWRSYGEVHENEYAEGCVSGVTMKSGWKHNRGRNAFRLPI